MWHCGMPVIKKTRRQDIVQALNLGESEASEELPALGAQISAEVRNSESLGIYFIIYIYTIYIMGISNSQRLT